MAGLPGGSGGAGGAGKPVPSTGSRQRHARQARFTLLSSVAGEAGGTDQPRSREAWKQKRPSRSQDDSKSQDSITGSFAVLGRTSSRPPQSAGCSNSEKRHQLVAHTCSWARAPCEVPARRRGSPCRPRSDRTLPVCSERKGAETPLSRAAVASTQSGWELGRNQLRSQDEEAALDKSAMPRRRAERVRAGKLGPPEFCGDKVAGAYDSPGGLD